MRVRSLLPLWLAVSLAPLAFSTCAVSQRLRFAEPRPIHLTDSGDFVPVSVTPADLDGDGNTDLIVYSESPQGTSAPAAQLELLKGDGHGGFTSLLLPIAPKPSSQIVVADVNGDGHPDILIFNGGNEQGPDPYEGAFKVYLGDGADNFKLAASYGQPAGVATATVMGDFNHDGMPDVAVLIVSTPPGAPSETASYLSIFINTGGGRFFQTQQVGDSQAFDRLGPIGDFSGDGDNDLILIDSDKNSFRILDGQGDGTYIDPGKATYTFNHSSILDMVSVNLTSDGRADLVASLAPREWYLPFTRVVTLFENQDGVFHRRRDIEMPFAFDMIQTADLNGDGKPDLFWLDLLTGSVGGMLGKEDARFGEPQPIARGDFRTIVAAPLQTGGLPSIFALGRVHGDRHSDLAVIVNKTR